MKINPNQKEIHSRQSSLALQIHHDDKYEFSFFVFNRRTRSIIGHYKILLMQHCRDSMQNIEPIKRKKRKEDIIAATYPNVKTASRAILRGLRKKK